ncbi:MAG TPA: hypothetical protein VH186_10765 [Chloroflexia bacterium]|nr:hypothetical protein [Chloroflexia bacterium]
MGLIAFKALERGEMLSSGFSRFRCNSPVPLGPGARTLAAASSRNARIIRENANRSNARE